MEFHEIANIFPMMDGAEYNALRDDIKQNGLIEQIVLYENKILDGRNRYRACLDADVDISYKHYAGINPVGYVVSKNLTRRHLDEGQRGMIAGRLANMKHGEKKTDRSIDPSVSQPEAAELMNVSIPTVKRAKQVLKSENEELIQAVDEGKISVSKAAVLSKQKNPVLYSSKSDEWNTPDNIIKRVVGVLGVIDLDPCSNDNETPNIPARQHYTKEDDGLLYPWSAKVYMNPPYGREIPDWIDKLIDEYNSGVVVEAIALVPSRTDTKWFRKLKGFPRCFIWGRLRFSNKTSAATFPSMAVYIGENKEQFIKIFGDIGDIYERV